MFDRLGRALQQHLDPNRTPPQLRQPTIESLLPGDVVSFWDGGDSVVTAVLECREALAINVKPKCAVDAMVATFGQELRD